MWYCYANSYDEAKLRAIEALTKYDSHAYGVKIVPVKEDYFEVTVYEFEETILEKMKEKE